jgi:hypothetical protein
MARPPSTPKPEARPVGVASDLFTPEELKELELKAKAEYEAEQKELAAEAFKDETKRKLRVAALRKDGKDASGDSVENVQINLAPHSPFISLDGRLYYHGLSYKFTQGQAQTIKEIMSRTWQHEREIGGANLNAEYGRTPLNRTISPNQAQGAI